MAKISYSIGFMHILFGRNQGYIQADETTHQFSQLYVEIIEKAYLLLIEGSKVILVILEKWGVKVMVEIVVMIKLKEKKTGQD